MMDRIYKFTDIRVTRKEDAVIVASDYDAARERLAEHFDGTVVVRDFHVEEFGKNFGEV